MRYIIGVDLGGTQIRAGVATPEGQIVHEIRVLTPASAGPDAVISQIASCIEQMRAQVPADGAVLGVGIGSPGPLDPFKGVVFTQPNMVGWNNVPLRELLEQRTGLPVELGNDANAAALGEWMYGGGKGTRNMVYVTVSTGIGGGVIVDGHLLLGDQGAAAEVGHHIIDVATRATWENLAAGPALGRAAAELMHREPQTMLHQLATPETVTAVHVAAAANAGDAAAQRLLDREGDLIGIGLVNLLYLYSPEVILLGGGVIVHNPALIDRAVGVIRESAFAAYQQVPVRLAQLGEQAGLLGAVALYASMRMGAA